MMCVLKIKYLHADPRLNYVLTCFNDLFVMLQLLNTFTIVIDPFRLPLIANFNTNSKNKMYFRMRALWFLQIQSVMRGGMHFN